MVRESTVPLTSGKESVVNNTSRIGSQDNFYDKERGNAKKFPSWTKVFG
jgi:hypothetical protein